MSAAEMLAAHKEVWDMPTLAEQHPEVLQHLASRYEVHFDMASQVVVVHKATGASERFATTDVRVAVETLLTRETAA